MKRPVEKIIDGIDLAKFERRGRQVIRALQLIAEMDDGVALIACCRKRRPRSCWTLKSMNVDLKFLHELQIAAAVVAADLSLAFFTPCELGTGFDATAGAFALAGIKKLARAANGNWAGVDAAEYVDELRGRASSDRDVVVRGKKAPRNSNRGKEGRR